MKDRRSNSYPPMLNQQTGQWHFYDDEGKPIDLSPPKPEPESDDEVTCCIRFRK